MPDFTTISDKINIGKAYYIEQLAEVLAKMKKGYGSPDKILPLSRVIRALSFQVDAKVNNIYTDLLYNCLIKQLQGFSGAYIIDPDVVIPGQTTVVVSVISSYNSDMVPLVSTDDNPVIQIADYQNGIVPLFGGTWASRYGNNPELALYSNEGVKLVGDEQTPPQRIYSVANDPTSPLLSIIWDYGIPSSVYVQISGVSAASGSGGSGSGGNVAPPLTFTQANLLLDNTDPDNPIYYLPLVIPQNKNVIMVKSNNVTVAGWVYNTQDYNPGRIYGFANNDTQSIKVQVL